MCDKSFYDAKESSPADFEVWIKKVKRAFESYENRLDRLYGGKTTRVLELGAGSCGLSLLLSRKEYVVHVDAFDISKARMERLAHKAFSELGGDMTKLRYIEGSFNETLPFNNEEFDLIVFDAALHHSRSIWKTLSEVNRVLRKDGYLIAQREAFLSPTRSGRQLSRLLETPEVAACVSENMYLASQYLYYLRVSGFDATFLRTNNSALKKVLSSMNGILFCDGVLLGKKVASFG